MNTTDYYRVEAAIRYLARHRKSQPELAELAAHIGLSQRHLHRLFSRWAGVTPKRFLEFLTVEHAKRLLDDSNSVLAAAHGSGLSGPRQAARSLRDRGSRYAGRVPEQRSGADDPFWHRRITVRTCLRRLDRTRAFAGSGLWPTGMSPPRRKLSAEPGGERRSMATN